jgi:nucleotide-binding universal stress UspA family protein
MKTILVPIDFSSASTKALNYAVSLAEIFQYSITLLHVLPPPHISGNAEEAILVSDTNEDEKKSIQLLKEIKEETQSKITNVESIIKTGFLREVLLQMEKEISPAFIVMGTTGASGFVNKLIGSNATAVMNAVSTPLLLIPPTIYYSTFKAITYCSSLEENEQKILKEVFEFAHKLEASIDVLKIDSEWQLDVFSDNAIINDIKSSFPEEKFNVTIQKADTTKEGIEQYLTEHTDRLLVMGVRHRNFLDRLINGQSVSKQIALNLKAPLLIYHQQ